MNERMNDPSLTILDIRESFELELASIDSTVHIPMGDIPNQLEKLDKSKTWVIMCHTGVRSLVVCDFLSQHGYSVLNFLGGIHAWSMQIDTSIPIY
jgi:rhodanese-related sulfurtransferase